MLSAFSSCPNERKTNHPNQKDVYFVPPLMIPMNSSLLSKQNTSMKLKTNMISLTTFSHILTALDDVIFSPFIPCERMQLLDVVLKVFGELKKRIKEWWMSDSREDKI